LNLFFGRRFFVLLIGGVFFSDGFGSYFLPAAVLLLDSSSRKFYFSPSGTLLLFFSPANPLFISPAVKSPLYFFAGSGIT
jgi:hypothetical protein